MKTLNFRYTEEIDVTVSKNFSSAFIVLKNKRQTILKINYRPYFQWISFNYGFFGGDDMSVINYVRSTAKDGSAFLARIYAGGGVFYAIRKKKRKQQIVFMKSAETGFKNFQLGKDVVDAVCYYDGVVSKNDDLLNDFFQKRQKKEFNEEDYINSLDSEERKEYLESKRIESAVNQIAKKNKLSPDDAERLCFFIECMDDDDEIKEKVLSDNSIDTITLSILPLLDKAKSHYESVDIASPPSAAYEINEYTIDSKHIFTKENFDLLKFDLNGNERFVYDLLYFFEDEYEQIKEYLNKGIERVKRTIDEALPFFKKYISEN